MTLADCLGNFRNSIAESNSLIGFAFQQYRSGNYKIPKATRDFITDSSFLKIFIAWETFLESSFIAYMIGEPSILGNVVPRYAFPLDFQHANNLLIGTNRYFDWADATKVRQSCNLYFGNGNPFETHLPAIIMDLNDLKIIRNAAAHLSSTTKAKLDAVASRKLKIQCINVTVSQLIFSIDPNSAAGDTILQTYLSTLDVSAELIANA